MRIADVVCMWVFVVVRVCDCAGVLDLRGAGGLIVLFILFILRGLSFLIYLFELRLLVFCVLLYCVGCVFCWWCGLFLCLRDVLCCGFGCCWWWLAFGFAFRLLGADFSCIGVAVAWCWYWLRFTVCCGLL